MSSSEGTKAILQSHAPSVYCHQVRISVPRRSWTMTVSVLKVVVILASQSGLIPISVFLNTGIMWPVCGKSEGRCGKLRVAVPEEFCVCPVAVPTVIGLDMRVKLLVGALG